jgi:ectoine hydroxylase-related dioxygenase (phytanoyl-CoA dioxygenase family)
MKSMMKYLTPEQYDRFQQDGFLAIEEFLTPDEVERTRDDIARVCEEKAALTHDEGGFNLEKVGGGSNFDGEIVATGRLRKIQGAAFEVPAVQDVFTSGKMLDCMEDLMGPEIYYHSSKVMFKPARGGAAKPWHQDAAYWRQYESKQITVWIAIHDASEENGCIWAIPGSHKLGLIPHVKAELQVEESRIDLDQAIPVPVPAGGLLIFHSLVLHASRKNESDQPRWAIICDYDCVPNPAIDAKGRAPADENNVWPLRTTEAVAV